MSDKEGTLSVISPDDANGLAILTETEVAAVSGGQFGVGRGIASGRAESELTASTLKGDWSAGAHKVGVT
ncbi:hypothetical protein GCM10011504_43650 [Siccirubricoccus deserti]|uniref:Uncharacterized protein n=1 Tax=Siccirubricoccus deserti TaxID=2013562 RepID=A0A9X0R3A4_9PROT|nr:hypothetical protein [Siccirubricoccus deserti]MBC4017628.1 hypothetical protein [Siccirubricoccus deserti]GGC60653.1 hypothetical protein GCM10011504_43650 [Siccirubricoccus deserti]